MSNRIYEYCEKQKSKSGIIRVIGILAILAVAYVAWLQRFETLSFKPDAAANLPAMFGYLLLICIFVERSIEVILSSNRGAKADQLDQEIEKLQVKVVELSGRNLTVDDDGVSLKEWKERLVKIQDCRNDYRADSRFMAIWIGMIIGVMVALVGVRILGNIVESESLIDQHKGWFTLVDVLLTGSVLAGGSEAFNKIMKVYNSFMTKSAENNKA